MRIEFNDDHEVDYIVGPVTVTLSKRNLLAMLHKLEMPGSARTLISGDGRLILKCETDEEHYPDRRPGVMHPDTERSIRLHEDKWA